jgi:hypothetical protein
MLAVSLNDISLETLSELLSSVKGLANVGEAYVVQSDENKLGVSFDRELEMLLNRHSIENGSNTPDFVLVSLLKATLVTWNLHTKERDRWWGNRSILGPANDHPSVPTDEKSLLPTRPQDRPIPG